LFRTPLNPHVTGVTQAEIYLQFDTQAFFWAFCFIASGSVKKHTHLFHEADLAYIDHCNVDEYKLLNESMPEFPYGCADTVQTRAYPVLEPILALLMLSLVPFYIVFGLIICFFMLV
jgi:hypothetical protein